VGKATQVLLEPENTRVLADGRSQVKVVVTVCDANGNVVPTANQALKLALKGGGKVSNEVNVKEGRGEFVVTAPEKPGALRLSASGEGLASA
jgi:hypothetical protein